MIVHLGWLGETSEKANRAADRIARSLPDDDVRFHTSEDLIWPAWRHAYERILSNPHMASDFLRHSLLRRSPGLWLDLDVTLRVPAVELVAAWDRYTVLKISGTAWAGTDVIYVPEGWSHWGLVDNYIANYDFSRPHSYLAFAHDMIAAIWKRNRDSVAVIDDAALYPCRRRNVTPQSVVLRCGLSGKPGLGDIVAAGLSAIGITPDRVSKALGVKDCGCKRRAEALNRLGRKFGIG
jgi:hypothetical protein